MAINLLPQEEKRELKLEKVQRKVFAVSIFILIFFFILMLIFVVLNAYISSRADSFRELVLEKEEEIKTSQFQGFKEIIKRTNQNLSKIQKLWQDETLISPFFEKLTSVTPTSIYFTGLSFQKSLQESEIIAAVDISGFAPTREILFFFKRNLEDDKNFEDVSFLPECWFEPTDIYFSLSLKYTP